MPVDPPVTTAIFPANFFGISPPCPDPACLTTSDGSAPLLVTQPKPVGRSEKLAHTSTAAPPSMPHLSGAVPGHNACLDHIPSLVDNRVDDHCARDTCLVRQWRILRIDGIRLTRGLHQGTSPHDSLCWLRRRRRNCCPCAAKRSAGKSSDFSPNYSPGDATGNAAQIRWGSSGRAFLCDLPYNRVRNTFLHCVSEARSRMCDARRGRRARRRKRWGWRRGHQRHLIGFGQEECSSRVERYDGKRRKNH